jgi:hypothetical protein
MKISGGKGAGFPVLAVVNGWRKWYNPRKRKG